MKTVLFFISSTRHSCRDRLEGIYRFARQHDWHVQVVERAFHTVRVRELLDFCRPIGVVAECGAGADELNRDTFGNLPVVYFDADRALRGPGHYIGSDSCSVAQLAAEHLLSLDLPNYAFAAYRAPLFWSNERKEAFAAAIGEAGRGCAIFDPGREQPPHRRQKELADWLRGLPRPCGIFAANDYVGEEIVNACAQLGLSVPDEIAVLGVDNDEQICENLSPTLSSIAPDFTEGGYMAAELLLHLIENPSLKPTTRLFTVTRLTMRQSTRRMVCDRSRVAAAVEMIRRRACEGISVNDVVEVMGVPRRTAEVHFRVATGHSILDEIDDIRFARVFDLLKNPRQSLDAIPGLCGFATGVALRKAFRLRTGVSMRDWRKRKERIAQK